MFNIFNISNLVGSAGLPTTAFNGVLTTVNAVSKGVPSGFTLGGTGSLLKAGSVAALAGVDRATAFGGSARFVHPSRPERACLEPPSLVSGFGFDREIPCAAFRDRSPGRSPRWIHPGRFSVRRQPYSARSVGSGSRVAARHAGRALAAAPITSSRAPAPKYVQGSLPLTP